jgi:hypothetical protein
VVAREICVFGLEESLHQTLNAVEESVSGWEVSVLRRVGGGGRAELIGVFAHRRIAVVA